MSDNINSGIYFFSREIFTSTLSEVRIVWHGMVWYGMVWYRCSAITVSYLTLYFRPSWQSMITTAATTSSLLNKTSCQRWFVLIKQFTSHIYLKKCAFDNNTEQIIQYYTILYHTILYTLYHAILYYTNPTSPRLILASSTTTSQQLSGLPLRLQG